MPTSWVGLYQIGIRCLGATVPLKFTGDGILYQIGIRCLGATTMVSICPEYTLYQIGIRCLGATKSSTRVRQL